jgi:hypothetical protein
MSKTPGEYEPRKLPSKEEKQARKALKEADAKVAMAEHEKTTEALDKNRERLKAERLAREPGEQPAPPKKKKAGLKTKVS